MDIFKQNRYLVITVVLLILLNLMTLTMFWIDRPSSQPQRPEIRNPAEEQTRVQRILKDELGFDRGQTEAYVKIRRQHREQVRQLNDEIRQVKRQMFDEVLKDNPQPMLSDSLLGIAQDKQAQIEQLTFQYFLDLKQLCNPNQRENLKILIHEVFTSPPAENDPGREPPPPPDGKKPPGPRPRRH